MPTKVAFYWHDWKEHADLERVSKLVAAVFNGRTPPSIVRIPDSQCDEEAYAVSSEPITPKAAQDLFLRHINGELFDQDDDREPLIFEI